MKQIFPKLAMTVAALLSFLPASAYDFEANGIYYNVTDATNHEVEVTFKEADVKSYSGEIDIPSTVTNEGTTYAVTSIGEWAFSDCSGLTSIVLPNSVTTIGSYAFSGCSGLTSVTIPNSVSSIGICSFAYCTGLTVINVDAGNKSYTSVDGVLYNKNLTEIIQYPAGKPGTTFSIPNSVTTIGDSAFSGCHSLTSVTIPNSVTSIGDWAFNDCAHLRSVYCHWEEPITLDNPLFANICFDEGTLYVPKGCADKYRLISPWSHFKKIEESDFLGVEDITENQPTGDYIVYDLQGVLRLKTANIDEVNQLPAGLYIVNGKKVLIR